MVCNLLLLILCVVESSSLLKKLISIRLCKYCVFVTDRDIVRTEFEREGKNIAHKKTDNLSTKEL